MKNFKTVKPQSAYWCLPKVTQILPVVEVIAAYLSSRSGLSRAGPSRWSATAFPWPMNRTGLILERRTSRTASQQRWMADTQLWRESSSHKFYFAPALHVSWLLITVYLRAWNKATERSGSQIVPARGLGGQSAIRKWIESSAEKMMAIITCPR